VQLLSVMGSLRPVLDRSTRFDPPQDNVAGIFAQRTNKRGPAHHRAFFFALSTPGMNAGGTVALLGRRPAFLIAKQSGSRAASSFGSLRSGLAQRATKRFDHVRRIDDLAGGWVRRPKTPPHAPP
jgi:hypothetical protein